MRLFNHRALKCRLQELVEDGKTAAQGTEVGIAFSLSTAKAHSYNTSYSAAAFMLRKEHLHTLFDS